MPDIPCPGLDSQTNQWRAKHLLEDMKLVLRSVERHCIEKHGGHFWLLKVARDEASKVTNLLDLLDNKTTEPVKPPTTIREIRTAIRGLGWLIDSLTGGTEREFVRQSVGPQLMVRIMEVRAIVIPARFEGDLQHRTQEIERAERTIKRWHEKRLACLDALAKAHTGWDCFADVLHQTKETNPALNCRSQDQEFLADRLDEAWCSMCSTRRVNRTTV